MSQQQPEQEQFFIDIDQLTQHGITTADILKLKNAGISTVLGLVQSTKRSLCKIKVRSSRLFDCGGKC